METSPAGIWRHLRRRLAVALLQTDAGGVRAVERLLEHRKGDLETLTDRDLSIVLEHLLEGKQVRDSAAWLRGEGLPDEVLQSLRLGVPGPEDDPEAASRHIVTAICELIRPGVVVFCMDQIEAVMSSPDDREGPHAFGKLVSCLMDETRNASVICCEQSLFVNLMEQILDNAAKSRVFGRRAAIHPLSWDQAQRLITARLDTVPEFAAERAAHAGCWPLAESQIREVFVDDAAPARKVIARCKDLFDLWRSGHAPVIEPLDTVLQNMFEERFAAKVPALTEAILRNAMPLLARAAGLKCSVPGNRSQLDFAIDGGRLVIAICNQANMNSLSSRLRKVSDAWKPAANQTLLLLRDARSPIPRTAKVTNERLAGIQAQGGRLLTISEEAVEALAALRRLLSDAESGDLADHGEPVTAGPVEQWIAGHLPAALDPLLVGLGASRPVTIAPPDRITAALAALLAERKMMTLEDAARSLEVPPGEVEECARRDPRQFGILGGGAPALFQPATRAEGS
jgi:hypothetical protein